MGMQVARVGDYELAYADRGSGEALILIHGLAGDHGAWAPQVEAWSTRFRVIAPDSRGAGRSTQVDEPISTETMARDMLALLDHLRVDRAHVVGRSMGGCIGQHMALLAPERVASLALVASCARFDPIGVRVLENMRDALERSGSWAVHARHSIPNFVSHAYFNANPDRVAGIEALIGSSDRLQACYSRQNEAVIAHDTLDQVAGIACPVLVASGGRDPICGPTATGWLLERLPEAERETFEGSSHFFLVEEPERLMDRWLARVAGG